MEMVKKTKDAVSASQETVGTVGVGAGETGGLRFIFRVFRALRVCYPNISCHVFSGGSGEIREKLDRGLLDFGILFDPADLSDFHSIRLPWKDAGGVLMRNDCPLAEKESLAPEDLWDKPLIISNQHHSGGMLATWLGRDFSQLDIAGTYNMLYSCAQMVKAGLGYAVCRAGVQEMTAGGVLCFRPLAPKQEVGLNLVWKRYAALTRPSEKFLEYLKRELEREKSGRTES